MAKACASLRLCAARLDPSAVPVLARRYQPRITHLSLSERSLTLLVSHTAWYPTRQDTGIPHGMVSHTAWYPTQHRHGRHLQLLRFCGVWRWSMRGGAPLPTSDGYGARTSRGVRPCERASCAPAVLAAPARRVGKFVVRRGGSGAVFVDEQRAAGEVGPPCTRQVKCCMLHVACCTRYVKVFHVVC